MKYSFYIFISLLCIACAKPVAPTGGPVDHTPPRVIADLSSPSFQTNFSARSFAVTFDEWVVLDKAEQNLLISPQLHTKPKISLKGKTLHFDLDKDEVLKPNTTYIIDFGNSIKDFNEGNAIRDFKFVFSTGAVIDSGTVQVRVVQFRDQKPLPDILVMLYESDADSLLYHHIPDYVGRTDSSGNVTLAYLRPGTYNLFALKDLNFNSKLDLTDEEAAYSDEKVHIPGQGPLVLSMFPKDIPPKITKIDSTVNGRLRLITDANTDGWQILPWAEHPPAFIHTEDKQVDLYAADTSGRLSFVLQRPLVPNDTFNLHLHGPKSGPRFHFSIEAFEGLKSKKNPEAGLRFNYLLTHLDSSGIQLYEGLKRTNVNFSYRIDPLYPSMLLLKSAWKVDSTYTIRFRAGSITDRRGISNSDSLYYQFKINDPDILSSISVEIDSLNPDNQYILRIIHQGNTVKKWLTSDTTTFKSEITGLTSGEYTLTIGEDKNRNGRIDGGSFDKRQLPERLFTRKLESLRENWSVEAILDMREFK